MGLGLLLAVWLPFMCYNGFFDHRALIDSSLVLWLMPIYYCFCIPAYIALISLDRLLAAIKRGEVFTIRNVRYLRILSWCCFAAAFILLISTLTSIVFAVLGIITMFFGIVLRVVKNLFAAAVALQDENNFTI